MRVAERNELNHDHGEQYPLQGLHLTQLRSARQHQLQSHLIGCRGQEPNPTPGFDIENLVAFCPPQPTFDASARLVARYCEIAPSPHISSAATAPRFGQIVSDPDLRREVESFNAVECREVSMIGFTMMSIGVQVPSDDGTELGCDAPPIPLLLIDAELEDSGRRKTFVRPRAALRTTHES